MINYNFDEHIERANTNCYKYDLRQKIFGTDDVFPMWVADTDFKAPDFITEALKKRLEHGVFGYSFLTESYYNSIIEWNANRHQWSTKPEWIKFSPGVVPSLNMAVLSLTEPGDKIIIQTPVYFPFYTAVRNHNRELVTNPLVEKDGRYQMDMEHLKASIDSKTKLLILCSPHNPTGNVWKREELEDICKICIENGITIISDEIHADIIYNGHKHIPTASLSEEIAQNTITLMAPSKTFNIAGLCSSYAISSNPDLLKAFAKPIDDLHLGNGNIMGIVATEAAYTYGEVWLEQLIAYFQKNLLTVDNFLRDKLPKVRLIQPEGTYLLWLDFSQLGYKRNELNEMLVKQAKVGLSDGFMFGKEGDLFQRMNLGCTNEQLKQALERMAKAMVR